MTNSFSFHYHEEDGNRQFSTHISGNDDGLVGMLESFLTFLRASGFDIENVRTMDSYGTVTAADISEYPEG